MRVDQPSDGRLPLLQLGRPAVELRLALALAEIEQAIATVVADAIVVYENQFKIRYQVDDVPSLLMLGWRCGSGPLNS